MIVKPMKVHFQYRHIIIYLLCCICMLVLYRHISLLPVLGRSLNITVIMTLFIVSKIYLSLNDYTIGLYIFFTIPRVKT